VGAPPYGFCASGATAPVTCNCSSALSQQQISGILGRCSTSGLSINCSATGGYNNGNALNGVCCACQQDGATVFFQRADYTTPSSPIGVAVGDFNGDGIMDIAVATSYGTVAVFLGSSTGTLLPGQQLAVNPGTGQLTAIASGDFNHDGKLDLVVSDGLVSAYTLLGNGDGTFTNIGWSEISGHDLLIDLLAIGDIDQDGYPDVVVADAGSPGSTTAVISWAKALPTGYFFWESPDVLAPLFQHGLVVADFNNDGWPDAAIAADTCISSCGGSNSVVAVFTNTQAYPPYTQRGLINTANYSTPNGVSGLVSGDFNGDGKLDLIVGITGSIGSPLQAMGILLGNGDGTFRNLTQVGIGGVPSALAAADFNGDGALDVVIATNNGTSVLLGNGDGSFQNHVDFAGASGSHTSVATGDFNGDGKPDFVVVNANNSSISVFTNASP